MVRGTGITTSLLLIALGAVLAFAINVDSRGIDVNTIGVILMLVGVVGLLFSFLALGDLFGGSAGYRDAAYVDRGPEVTTPHSHERVDTHDVVVEDDHGARTERVRRIRR